MQPATKLILTVLPATWDEYILRKQLEDIWAFNIWRTSGYTPEPRVNLMTPDGEPG